jgi:hypothetical protein
MYGETLWCEMQVVSMMQVKATGRWTKITRDICQDGWPSPRPRVHQWRWTFYKTLPRDLCSLSEIRMLACSRKVLVITAAATASGWDSAAMKWEELNDDWGRFYGMWWLESVPGGRTSLTADPSTNDSRHSGTPWRWKFACWSFTGRQVTEGPRWLK